MGTHTEKRQHTGRSNRATKRYTSISYSIPEQQNVQQQADPWGHESANSALPSIATSVIFKKRLRRSEFELEIERFDLVSHNIQWLQT